MRRYTVTDGIVIRRMPLPSGDMVVTLISEHGKWRAVARKGRLPGGNLGKLSLFHDVTVQYYRRKEEDLALLTQVQLNGALPRLVAPSVYPYANLLAELVDRLTVDVHLGESIHSLLASGLRGLNRHHDPEHVGLLYAWRLLGIAGLAPLLDRCQRCGAGQDLVSFDVAAGGLTCGRCTSGSYVGPEVVDELRDLVARSAKTAIVRRPHDSSLHWRLLAQYVGYHVGELHSLSAVSAARPNGAAPNDSGSVTAPDDAVDDARSDPRSAVNLR